MSTPAAWAPVAVLSDLRVRRNGSALLEIETLSLRAGRTVVLRGRNGAGKTTLLKVAAGLAAPDRADVRIGDTAGSWRRMAAALRRCSVYLHQEPYLFDATVADNVAYGLRRRGGTAALAPVVAEALEWAGLGHLERRNARALSGGERQRVALTRARVVEPAMLLLDEPFTAMDAGAREQTYALIDALRADGVGIVLTSHEPVGAELSADEVLEIEHCRLVSSPGHAGGEAAA